MNKTAHGLAYAVYGTQFSHKQTDNLRLTDIARAIDTHDREQVRDAWKKSDFYLQTPSS